jgi:hypothetical protein
MSSYIIEIQEDSQGEYFITFPEELIEELRWEEGDLLDWNLKGSGIILSKINDEDGYEVIEE